MSTVNFGEPGQLDQVSPSIWKDCPNALLNELGLGFYADVTFQGAPTGVLAAALDITMVSFGGGALKLDADTDTVLTQRADIRGGALLIETDGDDNDAAALFSQPFGRIVRNSGQKLWFEVIAAPGDVDADMGTFLGLVEADAVDSTTTTARDVLSDNVTGGLLVDESMIGFLHDNGNDDAYDLVYSKDAGATVTVLADVTNAAAITAAGGTVASLADGVFHKYGLKFDGRQTITVFVDGHKVAAVDVDSTFDQAKDLCVVLGIKTGAAAVEQLSVKRVRWAFQERGN